MASANNGTDQGHWAGIAVNPVIHWGFVYRLLDLDDGSFYIGKKNVWLKKQGVVGCKTAVCNPSSPKWKTCCWKESNWRTYNGSSKYWTEHIKENPGHLYQRSVVAACKTKGILHFAELVAIILSGSMTSPQGFNCAAPNCKFRPNTELWREMEVDGAYTGWFY